MDLFIINLFLFYIYQNVKSVLYRWELYVCHVWCNIRLRNAWLFHAIRIYILEGQCIRLGIRKNKLLRSDDLQQFIRTSVFISVASNLFWCTSYFRKILIKLNKFYQHKKIGPYGSNVVSLVFQKNILYRS